MMNVVSNTELKAFVGYQHNLCISIFVPEHHRAGVEMQQDPVSLKNQIREAEHRLLEKGVSTAQIGKLLEPLLALLDDKEFWQHPADTLAILRSPDVFACYRLPYSYKAQVVVTDHFYLKPLLPFLIDDGRFYILTLSQNNIRLFESTHYSIAEIELPDSVPTSLAEALKYDETENLLESHSSASETATGGKVHRASVFHGQGIGIDDAKARLLRYFQQVNRGLHEILHAEKIPMVLAGVEYLQPIYHEANTYLHLLQEGITGNPDKIKTEALHEQAWAIVEPYIMRQRQNALVRLEAYSTTEQASYNSSEIVPAAYYGRIDSLFVAINKELWGSFEPDTHTLHIHEAAQPGDDDLLEVAAQQTLLHGGSVHVLEHTKMPSQALLAAVFRY